MTTKLREALYILCKLHCYREEGKADTPSADVLLDYLSSGNIYGGDTLSGGKYEGLSESDLDIYHSLQDLLGRAHVHRVQAVEIVDEDAIWLSH
jgi:hypothetical protein